jgi:FkbM family methyltransferase
MLSGLKWTLEPVISRNVHLYYLTRRAMRAFRVMLPHERDYAALALFDAGDGIFLDVGANDGISALSFRLVNKTTPIVSIEANAHHEPTLAKLKRRLVGFDYVMCAAGDSPAVIELYTPIYKGFPLWSFASASKEDILANLKQHLRFQVDLRYLTFGEQRVRVRPLDDLALPAKIVKIDVEGYEASVLRGLTETTRRMRPVIMIAYSPSTIEEVAAFFEGRHYACTYFDDRVGRLRPREAEVAKNLFFLPAEQADRLLQSSLPR